jgi:hypothetical protein
MGQRSSVHLLATAPRGVSGARNRYGREAWVEDDLGDGWVAAYRLMMKSDRPVVAEVRLFPDDPPVSRGPGQWSEQASAVPSEGIPGRALRDLRLTFALERFSRFLRLIEGDPKLAKQLLGAHGIPLGARPAKRRPGRAGRADAYYLAFAMAYVERLAEGSRRPVQDLAEHPPKAIKGYVSDGLVASPATVRDIIHQARVRGLLTGSPPGRPGGELTPKAKDMLKRFRKP